MAQQVLNRGFIVGRHQLDATGTFHHHLLIGEGRDVFRHRVVQQQPALFPQHHRGNRNDRLGHRIDAEQRVLSHGVRGGGVALAECLQIRQPVVAYDGDHRTGDLPGLDPFAQLGG
jgi:hypothetical protein